MLSKERIFRAGLPRSMSCPPPPGVLVMGGETSQGPSRAWHLAVYLCGRHGCAELWQHHEYGASAHTDIGGRSSRLGASAQDGGRRRKPSC